MQKFLSFYRLFLLFRAENVYHLQLTLAHE